MTALPATTVTFPADHPAFAGHFPGAPLVPGALLLDAVALRLGEASGAPVTFSRVKFRKPVLPGATLAIELTPRPDGSRAFALREESGAIAADGVVTTGA